MREILNQLDLGGWGRSARALTCFSYLARTAGGDVDECESIASEMLYRAEKSDRAWSFSWTCSAYTACMRTYQACGKWEKLEEVIKLHLLPLWVSVGFDADTLYLVSTLSYALRQQNKWEEAAEAEERIASIMAVIQEEVQVDTSDLT